MDVKENSSEGVMQVLFRKCDDGANAMLFVVVYDKNNEEMAQFPIFIDEESASEVPHLRESLDAIPAIMQMMYNSGLKNEKIEFKFENVGM